MESTWPGRATILCKLIALDAEEQGLTVRFCLDDPGIPAGPDAEYIASYKLE